MDAARDLKAHAEDIRGLAEGYSELSADLDDALDSLKTPGDKAADVAQEERGEGRLVRVKEGGHTRIERV